MNLPWHDLLSELWRTGLLYVLAFVVFRLMGKRSVSHMAPFDIAVVIIIGETVAPLKGIKITAIRDVFLDAAKPALRPALQPVADLDCYTTCAFFLDVSATSAHG